MRERCTGESALELGLPFGVGDGVGVGVAGGVPCTTVITDLLAWHVRWPATFGSPTRCSRSARPGRHDHGGADAQLAGHVHRASHGAHQPMGRVQPHPAAVRGELAGLPGPIELIEGMLLRLGSMPAPDRRLISSDPSEPDEIVASRSASRRAVLDRVVEDRPQHLLETIRIGHGEVRRSARPSSSKGRSARRAPTFARSAAERRRRPAAASKRRPQAGCDQQLAHHAPQPIRLVADRVEVGTRRLGHWSLRARARSASAPMLVSGDCRS